MKRIFLTIILVLVSCAAAAQSPNSVIEEAVAEISIQLSQGKEKFAADSDALYQMVDDILLPRFDKRYAAQLVLGKHWRTADEHRPSRRCTVSLNQKARSNAGLALCL